MHDILLNLLLVLGSATLVATFFHALRLPTIVGFLVSGILVGPHGFAWIRTVPEVQTLTEIAAVLLMFSIGLEFNLKRLFQLKKLLFGLGSMQVLLTIAAVSFLCHHVLGMPSAKAVFFGFLVSLSSTAVVIRLLQSHRDMESPFGRASLSVLLFQDLAVVPMILLLPLLGNSEGWSLASVTPKETMIFIVKILLALGIVVVGARIVVPKVLHRVAKTRSQELFFFCILSFCVGTALGMEALGLSLSLGAFFAGIMISESPYGKQAMSDVMPMRDNFLGLFFVSIGMLVDTSFLVENGANIALFALIVFSLKFLIVFFSVWILGNPSTLSIITGLMLFQMGEFSFILATQGMDLGLMSDLERQYFLAISVFSLALTPLVYQVAPALGYHKIYNQIIPDQFQNLAKQVRKVFVNPTMKIDLEDPRFQAPEAIEGHTVIIGYGIAGQNLSTALKALKLPYIICDMNNETVIRFKRQGEPILFGDATKEEILHQLHLETARLVVLTVSGSSVTSALQRSIKHFRPDIPLIIRTQYLRDLKQLTASDKTEVVVAEVETSIEILSRTLAAYGVDREEVQQSVIQAKKTLLTEMEKMSETLVSRMDIPAWQAFSYLRPLRLKEEDFACGKSLLELDLRKVTGASIVALYREGLGTSLPDLNTEFLSGDTLYIMGNSTNQSIAQQFLKRGPKSLESTV